MCTNASDSKHMPNFKDANRTTASSGHTEVNEANHINGFLHKHV